MDGTNEDDFARSKSRFYNFLDHAGDKICILS